MKIAVVAGSAPPLSRGGVASSHFNLFRFLRSQGHDVRMFTHEDTGAVGDDDADIIRSRPLAPVRSLIRGAMAAWFRLRDPGTSAYQLSDLIEWTSAAPALRAKVSAFAPETIIVPDRGLPLLWLDVKPGCRIITVEHHNPARFADPLLHVIPPSRHDISAAVRLGQRALAKANVVVCPATYMLRKFEATFRFFGETRVIPHVVDEAMFDVTPRSVAKQLGRDGTAVYIPGGSPGKGERYLLALIRDLISRRDDLVFFVSGDVSPTLRAELDRSGVANRVFTPGALPLAENLAYVAGCRACMAPSLAENFSMAILESLWLGVPVAAFDVGGNADLVDETCGALVPLLDLVALSRATQDLVARDLWTGARNRAAAIQAAAKSGWLDVVT